MNKNQKDGNFEENLGSRVKKCCRKRNKAHDTILKEKI